MVGKMYMERVLAPSLSPVVEDWEEWNQPSQLFLD
jgi:hypothetical protein